MRFAERLPTDPTGHLGRALGGVPWIARALIWLFAAAAATVVVTTPLNLYAQVFFGAALFGVALLLHTLSKGRRVTLVMMAMSLVVSARYIYWRVTTTVGSEASVDLVLGLILLAAELYAFVVLCLGYHQTAWPLRRQPVALPRDPSTWPTVDVFIPTYNEPLNVVRATVLAAQQLDWPQDKLRVYILDDGRRDAFRRFAAEVGAGYIIRPDNKHAKAGNVNHAMGVTKGEFIAIFDCDHVPTRSFLQLTMGWMVRDSKLALVQTPHHFYSPDPFERNLRTFKQMPNEGELFYGVIQKGNDLWDGTFFCGSCAVIRRHAMEQIGGMARETVTEDAHTMLRMHKRGWRAAYIDLPQAAGLATESLSAHIGQRIRWARGMAQIFRIDNPLLARGLRLPQRLCYAAAMLHFFYGVPRIIFLSAPLLYLFFGAHIFNASAEMILAYAIPHLAHAIMTNSRVQGSHRHSFWAEVYEATLAYYITIPTTLALISPKLGSFNVTAKGGVIEDRYFDVKIVLPHICLLALNVTGAGLGLNAILTDHPEASAAAVNLAWTVYNILVLSACLAVAWEARQRRGQPRVAAALPAAVWLPDQRVVTARTVNVSLTGALVDASAEVALDRDAEIELALLDGEEVPIPATVVRRTGNRLHLRFAEDLSLDVQASIVRAVFSRPDAWLDWSDGRPRDNPLKAMFQVFRHGFEGVVNLPRGLLAGAKRGGAKLALLAGLSAGLMLAHTDAVAQPAGGPPAEPPAGAPLDDDPADAPASDAQPSSPPPSDVEPSDAAAWRAISLHKLGLTSSAKRYATRARLDLTFYARQDEVLTAMKLELGLAGRAEVPADVQALGVFINDVEIGRVDDLSRARDESVILGVDSRILEERNHLSLRFIASAASACPAQVSAGAWELIRGGTIRTRAAPLPLPSRLDVLPLPLWDARADEIGVIPIALLAPRSPTTLRAAGMVAAYFGLRGGAAFRYPVTFDAIPDTSAVVLAVGPDAEALAGVPSADVPTVTMTDHPRSPETNRKLLVFHGPTPEAVALAAERFAVDFEAAGVSDARVTFDFVPATPERAPWDAPFIVRPEGDIRLGDVVDDPAELTHEGAQGGSIDVRWRMPPDLFPWPTEHVVLDLAWRQEAPPGVALPALAVELNGEFLGELSAARGEGGRRSVRVPTAILSGYNHLQIHVVPPADRCAGGDDAIVLTTLDPDASALRTADIPRFATLPDVTSFVDDGYPFVRLADLSGVVVAYPDAPLPGEVGTIVSWASHAASITGVPPTGMRHVPLSRLDAGAAVGHDVVVAGVVARLGPLDRLNAEAPARVFGRDPALGDVPWYRRVGAFLSGGTVSDDADRLEAALEQPGWGRAADAEAPQTEARRWRSRATEAPGGARDPRHRAVVVGLESPWSPGRSVVAITATDDAAMPSLADLKGYAEATSPRADVMVLAGERRAIFGVGAAYEYGQIGVITRAQRFLSQHWVLLFAAVLVLAVLLGWMTSRRLAGRERARLSITAGTASAGAEATT